MVCEQSVIMMASKFTLSSENLSTELHTLTDTMRLNAVAILVKTPHLPVQQTTGMLFFPHIPISNRIHTGAAFLLLIYGPT